MVDLFREGEKRGDLIRNVKRASEFGTSGETRSLEAEHWAREPRGRSGRGRHTRTLTGVCVSLYASAVTARIIDFSC